MKRATCYSTKLEPANSAAGLLLWRSLWGQIQMEDGREKGANWDAIFFMIDSSASLKSTHLSKLEHIPYSLGEPLYMEKNFPCLGGFPSW